MSLRRLGNNKILLVLILVSLAVQFASGSIQCLDNAGKPVDWFVAVKLPDSTKLLYRDANKPQSWQDLKHTIDQHGNHALYHTLQQIYSGLDDQNIVYMMYNDEYDALAYREDCNEKVKMSGNELKNGHTKGDVCFDESTGFWLVHSVPHYPQKAENGYGYPCTGHMYGQSLLCVSYNRDQLDAIGTQLKYNNPYVYDHSSHDLLPDIWKDAVDGDHTTDGDHGIVDLTSAGGQVFRSFAKGPAYDNDLYSGLVAPSYQTDLYVTSWIRGNEVSVDCDAKYKVFDVRNVNFGGNEYSTRSEHSKWAASTSKTVICIGDINRMKSQFKRGGGTVCSELPDVAAAYYDASLETELCSEERSEL